ncbi:MAG TPA: FtsW/RodA/SpoVE family cell cycle protein [Patescibacteria group bacterium]|jgi:rod shape determining protein RodA|nr:FtsW/RodA/SpoVE family cell cycle protein [Patescibacteria group bacterium]
MNSKGLGIDWFLIIPVGLLVIISLVTLFSLNLDFFRSQFIFLIVSLLAFIFFSQTNYKILDIYSKPIYIVSLILLVLVLFLGIESRGSMRWVEFLGLRAQFSEILKPFLAISFASYLAGIRSYNFRSLLNVFLLLCPIAFLIFFQPDLGNALLYSLVVLATTIYLGFSLKYFTGLFLPLLAVFPLVWKLLHEYQRQRVLTFLDPGKDPLGTSYNVIQSVIAVGSGMLIGRGLGQGTQSGLRFLPERHTDFIFATISEQLGLIGAIIVLICFALILYKIYTIFLNSDDKFSKVFAAIIFFTFLIQIFVNIGMNIGILPIVGVTLPFVSYGGSSLLSNFIFLGFLSAISKGRRQEILEIK